MGNKEFYVTNYEQWVGGDDGLPYIHKVLVELFINKLAPLADPEQRLVFRVALWTFDGQLERRKRIAGIRYYPLQKKLTKITNNKVEIPFKVFNQKEVIKTIDKSIEQILNDKGLKEEIADTIDLYCSNCKKGWNCECKDSKVKSDW